MRSSYFAIASALLLLSDFVHAAQLFRFQLLPGKSALSYVVGSGEESLVLRAQVSGSVEFQLLDDRSVISTAFDLRIEGPIRDMDGSLVIDVPFKVGDKLADYLDVDFTSAAGLGSLPRAFGNQPVGSPAAYVGPDVTRDGWLTDLGQSFYTVHAVNANLSWFTLSSTARAPLPGTFSVSPISEAVLRDGEIQTPSFLVIPNIRLVPEPAVGMLLCVALLTALKTVRREL
jgi:hypothetical protein